jgi:hypothetical protein
MTAARRGTQTRSASAADARSYVNKAWEFLRAAEDSLELGSRVAAAGNAVHAGIGAADAITAARVAVVWKGEAFAISGSSGEGRWRRRAEGRPSSPPASPAEEPGGVRPRSDLRSGSEGCGHRRGAHGANRRADGEAGRAMNTAVACFRAPFSSLLYPYNGGVPPSGGD